MIRWCGEFPGTIQQLCWRTMGGSKWIRCQEGPSMWTSEQEFHWKVEYVKMIWHVWCALWEAEDVGMGRVKRTRVMPKKRRGLRVWWCHVLGGLIWYLGVREYKGMQTWCGRDQGSKWSMRVWERVRGTSRKDDAVRWIEVKIAPGKGSWF